MSNRSSQPPDPFIPPFLRDVLAPGTEEQSEEARRPAPRRQIVEESTTCGQVVMTGVYAVAVIIFIVLGFSNPLYLIGGLIIAGLIAQEYS